MDRILRDELVDKIFENAKLPILRVKASGSYDEDKLLSQIKTLVVV